MNEQHTPGPWAFAHRLNKGGTYSTEVFCQAGETIASFAWYPMPTVNGVTGTYRKGNARLCAAAPELLEALKGCLDELESPASTEASMNLAANVIRAVIAKATEPA